MSLETKQLLYQGSKLLDDIGIFDEHGHLCARTAPGSSTALVNGRTGPRAAGLHDFVEIDVDADTHPDAAPGETPIHTQILRRRDDVQAVCHHHAPYTVAVSSAGVEMRPAHPNGAVQASPITVYEDYHEEGGALVTTNEEGRALAEALGDDYVVALRGHGAVVAGESIADAIISSIKVEYNAQLIYHEAQMGDPWYLPESIAETEAARVHDERLLEKVLDHYLAGLDD